jgi:hypothetical protein
VNKNGLEQALDIMGEPHYRRQLEIECPGRAEECGKQQPNRGWARIFNQKNARITKLGSQIAYDERLRWEGTKKLAISDWDTFPVVLIHNADSRFREA